MGEIVVCWKWAASRPMVDPLTGQVEFDPRSWGVSAADEAALEVALGLGEPVTVVTAGPAAADEGLRVALAAGATAAVRCDLTADAPSAVVAAELAHACAEATLVLCGAHSLDRGSGAVPAFLAAELGIDQALGLVAITRRDDGALEVERRLDRGWREALAVSGRAVLSVEGSVARLRRAALPAVLAAQVAPITVLPGSAVGATPSGGPARPFRPRTRPRAAPAGPGPLARIIELTAALVDRTPPRVLHLDPPDAADAIVAQLRAWGYVNAED